MTEHGTDHDVETEEYIPGGRRRKRGKGRGFRGCLAVLVAMAMLAAGFWFAVTFGVGWVSDQFSGPDDYPGPGTGEVAFTVNDGDIAAAIGRNLKAEGVTKSVQAFIDAAAKEPKSPNIQAGVYGLRKEMSATDVVQMLVDPDNLVDYPTVTVPEGLRLTDIVSKLAEETNFSEEQFNKALAHPDKLGLPDYAGGNAEGYLFPATYQIQPGMKPSAILQTMVTRWRQAADQTGLEDRAAEMGKTPAEVMIIASLVQAEGRGKDMGKISRVIYNRLDGPGDKGGTNGRLQIDATVLYGLGLSPGSTELTQEQLDTDTPYNTRGDVIGLPPTPIEAPGDEAIEAALNPTEGPWYYYVTVDLATGETRFYETYDEFLGGQSLYKQYCETSDRC